MNKHLIEKIKNRESGIVLYGLTPPKINTDTSKILSIVEKQCERLKNMDIDGVVVYDLQDESTRTQIPRPFPFMDTIAPEDYAYKYMQGLDIPKIIYRSVGKLNHDTFYKWAEEINPDLLVLVGAPSRDILAGLSLSDAYQILDSSSNTSLLGGITIPERHAKKRSEHIHVANKEKQGCRFFISQCVYDVNASKNFLSDYYYQAKNQNELLSPIIFSLTPCGSLKTLEFSKWLGIQIPTWLENDLYHATDILSKSLTACKNIASELVDFSKTKNIPIGFNVESIAIRKEEIDASVELVKYVKTLF